MTISPFEKNFDTLLYDILTDYSNLDSSPDISEGSMVFIQGSVLASMLWGLYKYQDYIQKQHFPDTADTDNLNHHGAIYDIPRLDTDTDATYLNKILSRLRQPPAGGNKLDFKNWALDSAECTVEYDGTDYYNLYATVVDTPDDILGTVGIYTIPNDETIIDDTKSTGTNTSAVANKLKDTGADFVTDGVAIGDPVINTSDNSEALVTAVDDLNTLSLDADIFTSSPVGYIVGAAEELLRRDTQEYINTVRPLGMLSADVVSAKPQTQAVSINVTAAEGETVDTSLIQTAVETELDTMEPGKSLYKSTLTCLALTYGAATAVVTTPAAEETTIDNDKFFRKGIVTITEV